MKTLIVILIVVLFVGCATYSVIPQPHETRTIIAATDSTMTIEIRVDSTFFYQRDGRWYQGCTIIGKPDTLTAIIGEDGDGWD